MVHLCPFDTPFAAQFERGLDKLVHQQLPQG